MPRRRATPAATNRGQVETESEVGVAAWTAGRAGSWRSLPPTAGGWGGVAAACRARPAGCCKPWKTRAPPGPRTRWVPPRPHWPSPTRTPRSRKPSRRLVAADAAAAGADSWAATRDPRIRKHDFGPGNPGRCYRDHDFCTEICAILSHMSVLPCILFLLGCISASVYSESAPMW